MKRLVVFFLALALAASLAGCGFKVVVASPSPQGDARSDGGSPALPEYHSPDAIRERGTLRVGMRAFAWSWYKVPADFDPEGNVSSWEDGDWCGWEAEFMRAIAADLGVELECVEFDDRQQMLDALAAGEVDCCMSGLLIDAYAADGAFAVSSGYNLWGKADMRVLLKRGWVLDGSAVFGTRDQRAYLDSLSAAYPDAVVRTYDGEAAYMAAIEAGEITAIVESRDVAEKMANDHAELLLTETTVPDVSAGKGIYMMAGNDLLKTFMDGEVAKYAPLSGGEAAAWNHHCRDQAREWGVVK